MIDYPVILFLIIFIWCIFGIIIENAIAQKYGDDDCFILTPSEFYDNTNMNWFGCWTCFVLLCIVNPLGCAIKTLMFCIYNLCYFIKWLFTVGRKDEE